MNKVAQFRPIIQKQAAPIGVKNNDSHLDESARIASFTNRRELSVSQNKAESAIDAAANNRGRETNAFKAVHDYLQLLIKSNIEAGAKERAYLDILQRLGRIKDWDQPQWFKTEPVLTKFGTYMSDREFILRRNGLEDAQIVSWDLWADQAAGCFCVDTSFAGADEMLLVLDQYLVRRVAVDSVKNWLRRRPEEPFINLLFRALAQDKLYVDDPNLRVRSLADADGIVRAVESIDGKLYYSDTEQLVELNSDINGHYVNLPLDCDMVVFEKRTVNGVKQVVPIAQPNSNGPNIQWFSGDKVKAGFAKEQKFFQGPHNFTAEELYGFFPDHFPMRITNSQEGNRATEKTGAAIYGYARDHAGRQSRQLIADYGLVMPGIRRNNSQLISDTRAIFGMLKEMDKHGGKNNSPCVLRCCNGAADNKNDAKPALR